MNIIINRLSLTTIIFFGFVFSASLMAHSSFTGSNPGNGDVLIGSPDELVFSFRNPVKLVSLTLITENGEEIPITFTTTAVMKKDISVTIPTLDPNTYKVKWSAMSGDGHPLKGNMQFTVITASE